MLDSTSRSLKVFLCHASGDKPEVQKLYTRLISDGVDAWLDKEKLIAGQNWEIEIPNAVRNSDVVIVCLSAQSINKEGYVQKEIKIALDTADEKPEGTIFIIPARLDTCNVPKRISQFHWVDLFSDSGYEQLIKALRLRATTVGAAFEPSIFDKTIGTRPIPTKKVRMVTLSGQSGSGKSTIMNELLRYFKPLGWKEVEIGKMFRDFCVKQGYLMEQIEKISPEVHREFDNLQEKILKTDSNIILVGRMSGYLAYKTNLRDIFKIYCDLPLERRIAHFATREEETLKVSERKVTERDSKNLETYSILYNLEDYRDKKYYDLYLDTTKSPNELIQILFDRFNEFIFSK